MILLQSFGHGFFFGLGFFCSFIAVLLFLIFFFAPILKQKKESKLREKLSLEMLEEYRDKLLEKSNFVEAAQIRDYIKIFQEKQPMDVFFKHYKIVVKIKYVDTEDEDEKDSEKEIEGDSQREFLGMQIQKKYYIKKR